MRIGIVHDLRQRVESLKGALAHRPEHRIAWVAKNGAQAVMLCERDRPDLVLMDVGMPGVDGAEATRLIMASSPCAVLVVTASIEEQSEAVFRAMGHGAVDAINTPVIGRENPRLGAASFLAKLDSLAKLISTRRFVPNADMFGDTWVIARRERLVAIGASAGGPAAVARLLKGLPKDFPAAVIIVQHVDERFVPNMAEWLGRETDLAVRPAEEGERLAKGVALLARTNDHLLFKSPDRVGYSVEPKNQPYRPSVDVLFESATRYWTGDAVGVLLTGMGRDGARGLKTMRNKGHYTIAQDEATSAVYGMPKAAATLGAAVDILPLDAIAPRLVELVSR